MASLWNLSLLLIHHHPCLRVGKHPPIPSRKHSNRLHITEISLEVEDFTTWTKERERVHRTLSIKLSSPSLSFIVFLSSSFHYFSSRRSDEERQWLPQMSWCVTEQVVASPLSGKMKGTSQSGTERTPNTGRPQHLRSHTGIIGLWIEDVKEGCASFFSDKMSVKEDVRFYHP